MNDFKFSCPKCQQHFLLEESHRGIQVDCPTCGNTLEIPPVTPSPTQLPTTSTPAAASSFSFPEPEILLPPEEIKVTCPACSQHIKCDSAHRGMELNCPTCSAKMTVPSAEAPQPPNHETVDTAACPGCGEAVSSDAVICVSCGFNIKSGLRLQTQAAHSTSRVDEDVEDQSYSEEAKSGIMGMYEELSATAKKVKALPEFKQPRPGRLSGFKAFSIRAARALRLIFTEKELIVFGLLQWAVIGVVYYIWVQILGWIPEETWANARESDGVSTVDIVFGIWSILCIGLAAFPLGILSGCMGAVTFLNRQGQESTIARCLQIVLPHSFRLWVFHWIDAVYTCHQILERLPKKKDGNSRPVNRALSEALYYAWKLGTAGVMPGLVMGKSLWSASKGSVLLVKDRFLDVALLRAGYSGFCWVIGILAYIVSLYFFWVTGFFTKTEGLSEGIQIFSFFKLAGIPILVAVGAVIVFIRPLFIISLCDIYSEQMVERGETIEFSEEPGKGKSALVAFGILAVIVTVGGFYIKPYLAKESENSQLEPQVVSNMVAPPHALSVSGIGASSEIDKDSNGRPTTAERLLDDDNLDTFWNGTTSKELSRLADASARDPENTVAALNVAALQVWFDQNAAYAETRKRVLNWAVRSPDAAVAERAAKIAALRPINDIETQEAALTLARRAVARGKNDPNLPWFQMALGMAEFRAGNYRAADRSLLQAINGTRSLDPTDRARVGGTSNYYLVMSLARQDRGSEARQRFSRAAASMKPMPTDKQSPLINPVSHDDVILWLAYKETNLMLSNSNR